LLFLGAALANGRNSAGNSPHFRWHGHCIPNQAETLSQQPKKKGETAMFKKFLIALGIVTLTSTSAFAAKASHKAPASISAKKVAQADSAKPADAKGKKGKKGKKDKKGDEKKEAAPEAK
jgi:hypothetical protein